MNRVERNQRIRDAGAEAYDRREHGDDEVDEAEAFFSDRTDAIEEEIEREREEQEERLERIAEQNRKLRGVSHRDPVRAGERARAEIRERYEERQREPERPSWRATAGLGVPGLEATLARFRVQHDITPEEWRRLNDATEWAQDNDTIAAQTSGDVPGLFEATERRLEKIRAGADADYIRELQERRAATKRRY